MFALTVAVTCLAFVAGWFFSMILHERRYAIKTQAAFADAELWLEMEKVKLAAVTAEDIKPMLSEGAVVAVFSDGEGKFVSGWIDPGDYPHTDIIATLSGWPGNGSTVCHSDVTGSLSTLAARRVATEFVDRGSR